MKERIQEALRRRHRKGDEGFTLIELLVVILIIAILAAVGIIALLSALNSSKKSSAKTTARQAQSAAESVRTGLGDTDYTNVTAAKVFAAEPNLIPAAAIGDLDTTANQVFITQAGGILNIATRSQLDSSNHVCYFVQLQGDEPTKYASTSIAKAGDCALPAAGAYTTQQKTGWDK